MAAPIQPNSVNILNFKFHLVSLKLVQLYHGVISQMSILHVLKALAVGNILACVGLL